MRGDRRVRSLHSKRRPHRTSHDARQLFHEPLEDRLLLTQTTGLFFNDPGASDGYTLFSPNTTKTAYLMDKQGDVVHQWNTDYVPGLLAYLLPDGSLITDGSPHGQGGNGSINAAGAGGLIERYAWAGNLIWQYSYDSPTHLAHHDFRVLPNGNVLIVAWELKTAVEATQAGRNPSLPGPGYLYPDSIVEVKPDLIDGVGGDIVWEWHVWDHLVQQFDSTKGNWLGPTGVQNHPELINVNYVSTADDGGGQAQDWNHTNGIDYNPALDQILVSVREFSEVWIIDHSTTAAEAAIHSGGNSGKGGDLLYRWGNPQTYGAGTASDRVLYYQHNAKWVTNDSPGAGDITVFNNGFGRPGQDFTTVEEIAPPVDVNGHYALTPGQAYGPTTTTWTYTAPLANFTAIIGGAQRLPDGNTLISYGVNATFTEVTPAGQEVWKYVSPYTAAGVLGPTDPIPSLGIPGPGLDQLHANFVFRAIEYPLGYVSQLTSTVVGRELFYSGSSRYDTTGNPQTPLPFSDDNAIATDKSAYIANGTAATFANVSTYDKGLNGVMVDLQGGGLHGSITLAGVLNDFTFKVGNNNSPDTWAAAPLPITVTVRAGAGISGSDRVELIWAAGAIQQQWLEVTVKATANTGLAAKDVFFYGNEIGATGSSNTATIAKVTSSDVTDTQTHGATLKANIPVTNIYDFNKDGQVGSADVTDVQTHGTTNKNGLAFINIAAGGPFAPAAAPAASSDAGVASALVGASTSASAAVPAIGAWTANRLAQLELNHGQIARYFERLAHDNTPKSRAILVKADQVADALDLDDTQLDSLCHDLCVTRIAGADVR